MTNTVGIALTILATHTSGLKTNVTESLVDPKFPANVLFLNESRGQRGQEKWVTTTVERVERLQFVWQGKVREMTEVQMVSSNTVHLRIKQEWEPVTK